MPYPPAILSSVADPTRWEDVPALAQDLFQKAAELTALTMDWSQELPPGLAARCSVYWMPLRKKASLVVSTPPAKPLARPSLPSAHVVSWGLTPPDDAWIQLHPGGSWDQFTPKLAMARPLAVALAGSALGAGLGYAGGWLGEKLIPGKYREPGVLRRRAAVLGGLAGALPGTYLWSVLARQPGATALGSLVNKPFQAPSPVEKVLAAPLWPTQGGQAFSKTSSDPDREQQDWFEALTRKKEAAGRPLAPDREQILTAQLAEYAAEGFAPSEVTEKLAYESDFAGSYLPQIPVDQFNRVIWQDPSTPLPVRAATTGLTTAAQLANGGSRWVSPLDIAQVAVGAGSGLLSGLVVGKTLGALAGLSPAGQEALQNVGLWSGILTSVVPKAFGR